MIKRFEIFEAKKDEYTLLQRVTDSFVNLMDEHPGITVKKGSGGIVNVTIPGIVGVENWRNSSLSYSTGRPTFLNYTLDDYVTANNKWNEILLDVSVISEYLSTLDITNKLEHSVDYRNIKILFFSNPKSGPVLKVNPKSIYINITPFMEKIKSFGVPATSLSVSYKTKLHIHTKSVTKEQLKSIYDLFLSYGITTGHMNSLDRGYPYFSITFPNDRDKSIYIKESL